MPVRHYLDLSTGHVTEAEMDAVMTNLPDLIESSPRVIAHDYGAWVNTAPSGPELRENYPNLARCLDKARELDCDWINLDRDAGTHDGLPIFDW